MNFIHMGLRFTVSRGIRFKRMFGVNCLHIPSSEVALSAHTLALCTRLHSFSIENVCVYAMAATETKKSIFFVYSSFYDNDDVACKNTMQSETLLLPCCYLCVAASASNFSLLQLACVFFHFFRSSIQLLFTRLLFVCV